MKQNTQKILLLKYELFGMEASTILCLLYLFEIVICKLTWKRHSSVCMWCSLACLISSGRILETASSKCLSELILMFKPERSLLGSLILGTTVVLLFDVRALMALSPRTMLSSRAFGSPSESEPSTNRLWRISKLRQSNMQSTWKSNKAIIIYELKTWMKYPNTYPETCHIGKNFSWWQK